MEDIPVIVFETLEKSEVKTAEVEVKVNDRKVSLDDLDDVLEVVEPELLPELNSSVDEEVSEKKKVASILARTLLVLEKGASSSSHVSF